MRVLVVGATGFVGHGLVPVLIERGHAVVAASRDPVAAKARLPAGTATCAAEGAGLAAALATVDAVVNVAGDPIFEGRWTAEKKERIRSSRAGLTRLLVAALAASPEARRPRVLVNASAIGWYGDTGEQTRDEGGSRGSDFLARVCIEWEDAARAAEAHGVRVVLPRLGIVLERGGGALLPLERVFRLCAGAPLGPGTNWMSWIHRRDLAELLARALDDDRMRGPVNAVAPEPARQIELCRGLARRLHRPCWPGVPRPIVRVMFGEKGDAMLASSRIEARVLRDLGFPFAFGTLDAALDDIYRAAE